MPVTGRMRSTAEAVKEKTKNLESLKNSRFSARSRNRTGTELPPKDFKSFASTYSAIRANGLAILTKTDIKCKKYY